MTGALLPTPPAPAEADTTEFNPWVTTSSRFLDAVWTFERWNRGRTAGLLRIDWRLRLADGSVLTDGRYAALLRVGRELVYLLMTTPPAGRRRHRPGSAISVAQHLFAFFRWLIAHRYTRLAEVDTEAISGYRAWIFARRARNGRPLAANTLAGYFVVVLDLHRFRTRLSDGLSDHPFDGMELEELLGSLAPTGEIPHVPMDIAVPFLLVAVRWVREHGPEIAAALERAEDAYAQAAAQGRRVAACEIAAARVLQEFRFEHSPLIDGQRSPEVLTGLLPLRRLVRFAITASFIVVAALTGMRLSELLGLAEDCLERLPLEDGSGDSLLYVRGILLKTAASLQGEPVRWVAGIDGPDNHVRAAIELVRRLTAGLRDHPGEQRLFLNILLREGNGQLTRPVVTPSIGG